MSPFSSLARFAQAAKFAKKTLKTVINNRISNRQATNYKFFLSAALQDWTLCFYSSFDYFLFVIRLLPPRYLNCQFYRKIRQQLTIEWRTANLRVTNFLCRSSRSNSFLLFVICHFLFVIRLFPTKHLSCKYLERTDHYEQSNIEQPSYEYDFFFRTLFKIKLFAFVLHSTFNVHFPRPLGSLNPFSLARAARQLACRFFL